MDKTEKTKKEAEPAVEEDKPLSIVDEARAIRDEIVREKEELKKERTQLEKVQSEALLSGTAGPRQEPEPPKERTPKEYADEVMSGKFKAK